MVSNGSSNNKQDKLDFEEYDEKGWTPLHHAAREGYFKTVSRLLDLKPSRLELRTTDELKVTPLWLAFSEGRIETIDTLLIYNGDLGVTDAQNRDVIDIAFENKRCKLLLHLMKKIPTLISPIWEHLQEYTDIEHLHDGYLMTSLEIIEELSRNSSGIASRETLLTEKIFKIYRPDVISEYTAIEVALVNILQNIANTSVGLEVNKYVDLLDTLTQRLMQPNNTTSNKTSNMIEATILEILQTCQQTSPGLTDRMILKERFADIVKFMENCQDESLLLLSVGILRRGMKDNSKVQSYFYQKTDLLNIIVKVLSRCNSRDDVQVLFLKTLRSLVEGNTSVQRKLVDIDIFESLKSILSPKTKSIVKEISKLICTTTAENKDMQLYYIRANAIGILSRQLKKMKDDTLHEWTIKALWAIGGGDHDQILLVAKSVNMLSVVGLATSNSSAVLQYYGGEILRVYMRLGNQCLSYLSSEAILLHLLNSSLKSFLMTSEMLISALKTIQSLCTGRGHTSNRKVQAMALEKNSIQLLVHVGMKSDDPWVELEAFQTIANVLLCHPNGLEILKQKVGFPPARVLKHFRHDDLKVRSKASHVLATILLEKDDKEKLMKKFAIPYSFYEDIQDMDDGRTDVDTAFQLVVLKDRILKSSHAETVIVGIELLRKSLQHPCGDIIAIAADHISGLAQYCPGMRAALTTAGFVDVLCDLMQHKDDTVKTAVAVAIAVLARYLSAEILLLRRCRQEIGLVGLIESWTDAVMLPQHFKGRWIHYLSLHSGE